MRSSPKISSITICLTLIFIMGQANPIVTGTNNNCVKYDSKGKCIECADRYWLDSSTCTCVKVNDYCLTWNPDNGLCLTCFPGYGSPRNGVCLAIPSCEQSLLYDLNCQCYSDDRVCIGCYSGYKLNENRFCIPSTGTNQTESDNCIKYWYGDSKGKWYNNWFDGCHQICK